MRTRAYTTYYPTLVSPLPKLSISLLDLKEIGNEQNQKGKLTMFTNKGV